jgi:hypothetical protein
MCKTGSKLGQMAQVLGAGDTLSSEAKLVLSAGKGENDAIDAPTFSEWENLVVQQSRDISLSRKSVMNDNLRKEFDRITDVGKARSDEYTERLLAFVQDMEASGPEPFIPLLADIALVRALIVHLVIRYGPERGLVEARDAFNTTFDQMKPILQNMQEEKGHPPQ